MKSLWLNNSLRFNAAVFYTEIDDYQFFNFFAGSFGLLRVVNNIDEVEIYGAEIDFAWPRHRQPDLFRRLRHDRYGDQAKLQPPLH